MTRSLPAGTLLLAGALLVPSCAKRAVRPAADPAVVALVGDRPVKWDDVAAYLKAAAGEEPKDVAPRVASSLLDQYVEELLLDRAEEDAMPAPEGSTAAERRRSLIARQAGLDSISEEDLRDEYVGHSDRFRRPALIRVSQLLFRTREAADAAQKRLQAGEPWPEISRTLSLAPNAATGGSLGLLARTDLPREFEKVLWGLEAGTTTGIVAAPHGFHILRVDERFEARDIPFDEAKPALRLSLAEERSAKAAADLVAAARQRHPVAVVEEHLPFPYVGMNPRYTATPR